LISKAEETLKSVNSVRCDFINSLQREEIGGP